MKNNHETCSDTCKKKIKGALGKLFGETTEVENIYFQSDADFKPTNGKRGAKVDDEKLRHRILLSFVLPCPKKNSQVYEPKRSTRRNGRGEIYKPDEVTLGNASVQNGYDTRSLSDESESKSDENKNTTADDLFNCLEDLELSSDSGELNLDNDVWMKLDEIVNTNEIASVYFPLSPDKLHATINEQLNRSYMGTTNSSDFKSSLFNDVANSDGTPMTLSEVKMETVSNGSSPEYITSIIPFQNNQASDDYTSPNYGSSILIASSYQQQDGFSHTTDNFGQLTYSMAPSQQPKSLRPAILPAASTLVNGGGNRTQANWQAVHQNSSMSRAVTVPEKANANRASKPAIRIIQGHSRPALLVPKSGSKALALPGTNLYSAQSSIPTTGVNLRSRKTSPLVTKPTTTSVIATSKENNDKKEVARSVPEGYTYESWILEEGLHKARKLGLHRNTDKDFFPFTCPLCDKKYRNPNGIKYHARYAHGPKCCFNCDLCGKTYATRHGLAAHRRAHESSKLEKETKTETKIRPAAATYQTLVKLEPYEESNDLKETEYPVTLAAIKTEPMDFDLD